MSEEKSTSVTVKVTPRPLPEVEKLEREVNDYIGQNEELVKLLEDYLNEYERMAAENEKLKELLKSLLTNPLMGNAIDKVRETIEKVKKDV